MTWTYSVTDLATSPKDAVRLAIGDTISSAPQLQDEEINAFIAGRSSLLGACADCCRALASQYSRSVSQAANTAKVAFSDLSKAYAARAIMFEVQAASSGSAMPYAGGISIADKQNQEQNADRVPPNFQIGMDDDVLPNPSAGLTSVVASEDNVS